MNSESLLRNTQQFLKFMKEKYFVLHRSNIFFRDLQYGVIAYLADHGKKISYREAEELARDVAERLGREGILRRIDHQSFLLNYPDFALPRSEKKAS